MTRTDDDIAIDCSARELAAIMRADIFNRIELAADVEHGDERTVDLDLRVVTGGDGSGGRDCNPSHCVWVLVGCIHIMPVCSHAASDIIL